MNIEDYFKHIDSLHLTYRSKVFMTKITETINIKRSFENLDEFLTYINLSEHLDFDELFTYDIDDSIESMEGIYIQLHYKTYSKFFQYDISMDDENVFKNFRKKLNDNKYSYNVNEYFRNLLKINKRCLAIDKLLDI